MEGLIKGLFGGQKPVPSAGSVDNDFADYAEAPNPSPASISPNPSASTPNFGTLPTGVSGVTYTKWYRVWERTSPSDFYQEALILPFIVLLCGLHYWGRQYNKRKARSWIAAHAPTLEKEFAVVGFGGRKAPSLDDVQSSGLAKAMASDSLIIPDELLKEKTAMEYITYATGRQNVAFMDIKISLYKRYNPLTLLIEYGLSAIMESIRTPSEKMEATIYAFDGKEKDLVPVINQHEADELDARLKGKGSTYDGFVWAVVHKDAMRQLRDDRYDISLTTTKDHPKLPAWATIMSESAEVTDHLLTSELIEAVEQTGDEAFENLVITDQPLDRPRKLDETAPKKRVTLTLRLPSSASPEAYKSSLALFSYYLRLPDILVNSARFRPEVMRKIRATRDEEIRKLRKVSDEEKAEDRRSESDKKKKSDRDAKLGKMSADEQRKFLDKEREKEQRKLGKRQQKKA